MKNNKDNVFEGNNFIIGIIVALVLFFLLSMLGFGGMMGYGGYGGMMSNYYSGFGYMWIFGSLIMILVLIALVLLIIWLMKKINEPEKLRR